MCLRQFYELAKVDNLMITPVANVGPGVFRLGFFPIDTLFRNAIGVITVRCRGANKLADNVLDESGCGGGQGFPVLKNIAPVTRIRQTFIAISRDNVDRKLVPGSGWVSMPAAERQRQILQKKSEQKRIICHLNYLSKLKVVHTIRQRCYQGRYF